MKARAGSRGKLPFLFINMAMTTDGKIATENREVSSFGSERDKRHLLELRAAADAVMAGARTIDLNPVTMGPGPAKYRRMRVLNGLKEYNTRVIVSRTASVNPDARIFQKRWSPIIVLTTASAPECRTQALSTVAIVKAFGDTELDLISAFRWLRKEHGIRRLLCEGGGELNDALFRAELVDELHLTVCPFVFGGRGAPTISDGQGVSKLTEATRLRMHSHQRHGNELFLVYRRAGSTRSISQ